MYFFTKVASKDNLVQEKDIIDLSLVSLHEKSYR